jgi:hypothetical protein
VVIGPGLVPLVGGVVEVEGSGGGGVDPRLASDSVREPSVGASDGDVHDEVERSVERRRVVVRLEPGVLERDLLGSVLDDGREVSSVPEALLLVIDVEDLVDSRVDV